MNMELQGVDIKEVWDYRLSSAVPQITRTGGTWVAEVHSKKGGLLESHDTGLAAEDGDEYDTTKVITCYEWLLTVRDKYSLADIEERKSLVAKINAANQALADLGSTK